MNYIFTLFVLISLSYSAHSQLWFDAGLKGAWGATLMYDNNVFDSGTYKHKLTPGTAIGGRLGINFGYHAGISLEYQGATSNQDFELNSKVLNRFKWKHNDILALFRWSGNGGYVEIGGEYSHIKDVSLIRHTPSETTVDVADKFQKSYKSGVFGFGSYLMGGGLFTANLGVRFHWSIDDMVNDAGKEARIPFTAEVNESYDPSKKTLATAAQLQLELNYAFGRFAKSACHDKWRLLLFQ
jgi:hypothetical protein